MRYYSLKNPTITTDFKTAVINGIAPDRGLYFPNEIPRLAPSFFDQIETMDVHQMAVEIMTPFVSGEIPKDILEQIIKKTLDFDFPIVPLATNIGILELFQGPTLAFKDVGARFMAQCLGYFNHEENNQEITVLVATSGDTGGAVANGFLGVKGIKVVILYPKGKVSDVQERQLTTLGENITALEVDGVFDDCQEMVKNAFLDSEINSKRKLTSANSINIARWLPQMLYYFIAYKKLKKQNKTLVFSVPSGNFGNICAGMIAQQMGVPIDHFIASTNVNDTVPAYLESKEYSPKPTVATISNAMDVSDPSNFVRIQKIYENNFSLLSNHLSAYRFTDIETRAAIESIYVDSGYIADPHGAVGYLGLKKYLEKNPEKYGLFLETAHPVKFLDTVESSLNIKVPVPERIKVLFTKEKQRISISDYTDLKAYLLT